MVKRSIDQKHRLRNFDARYGRIESGAVRVESEQVALKEEKVSVTGGKKKANIQRDTSAVSRA